MPHASFRRRCGTVLITAATAVGLVLSIAPGAQAARPAAGHSPWRTGPVRPLIAFSTHPSGTVPELTGQFRALKAMGTRAVRVDFSWTHIEPQGFDDTGASYDWAQNDADVTAAAAAGLQVNAVLAYSHPRYSTGSAANGGDDAYPPDDPATFARFAADVARHYRGRIARFEVWNEENLGFRFWKPQADPAGYGSLLCAAYSSLKSASPGTPVSTGGVFKAPAGDFTGYLIDGADFLDQMLTATGNRQCFDAVAYHPYPYPFTSPEATVDAAGATSVDTYPAKVRAVLDAHGISRRVPLWNTEVGWPTNPTANGVSEDKQAEYTIRTNLLAWQHGVPLITWYDQYDSDDADQTTGQESHFGFFHHDGTPKRVVAAMRTLNRTLGGPGLRFTADLSGELGMPPGDHGTGAGTALEFTGPRDRHVLALWYANENVPAGCSTGLGVIYCPVMPGMPAPATTTVTLHLPPGATLTTMRGTAQPMAGRPRTARLPVGQAPLYVSWRGRPL